MKKITISNQTFTTKRVKVRGQYRQFVWEKGKIKTHVQWKRDKHQLRRDIEEKLFIYRSSYVLAYSSVRHGLAEYRVWVHTKDPDVTEAQLEDKMKELFSLFGIDNNSWEESYPEFNEPIHNDEKRPGNASLGEWFGYVKFNREGKVKEYYALGNITLMESTGGF